MPFRNLRGASPLKWKVWPWPWNDFTWGQGQPNGY